MKKRELARAVAPNNNVLTNFFQSTLKFAPIEAEGANDSQNVAANVTSRELARVSEGATTTCENEDEVDNGTRMYLCRRERERTHML